GAQGLSASTAGTATVKTAFQTAYITTPGPQRTNWMPGDRPQAPFTRLRHSSPEPLPDARNLRQMLKVTIAREEDQLMLHHQRCDPNIVGRNGRSLPPELHKQPPVLVIGAFIGIQHLHSRSVQKPDQVALILCASRPTQKSRPQFTQHDRRQGNLLRMP